MALNARPIIDEVVSRASTLGLFERVNSHEPKSRPGNGLTAAVWVESVGPAPRNSGLSQTSALLVLSVRLYSSALQEPADAIDPDLVDALDKLLAAYSGDFDLGGNVRNIDLLGMAGTPMSARAGYMQQDSTVFRVMTITLPVIVDDVWQQVP